MASAAAIRNSAEKKIPNPSTVSCSANAVSTPAAICAGRPTITPASAARTNSSVIHAKRRPVRLS